MELQLFRGSVALLGEDINRVVADVLQSSTFKNHSEHFAPSEIPPHITLLSKAELRSLGPKMSAEDVLRQLQLSLGREPRVYFLGLGGHFQPDTSVLFVVCIWAKGQQLRKQLGFPPKHFHITLSKQDVHNIDKGISTLFQEGHPPHYSSDLLDHLVYTLYLMQDYSLAKEYAVQLCCSDTHSERGFLRLGDITLRIWEHKLAMLAFASAFNRTESDQARTIACRRFLCVHRDGLGCGICGKRSCGTPDRLKSVLVQSWSPDLRTRLSDAQFAPSMRREPREQIYIPSFQRDSAPTSYYKLPRYFRWLVPFHIALMSTPRSALDIEALASPHIGIRHVLTLTEEMPLPQYWFNERIKNTYLPIPDHHPLSIEQMDLIIQLIRDEDNLPMLIHCAGGKGRTGTVAACYLAAFGFGQDTFRPHTIVPTMSASKAISDLRTIRPVSLETEQQEAFVSKWCSAIWKRQSVFPELVLEPPPCPPEIMGTLKTESNLFIFVGLPGAGKSWVARALLARHPAGWRWVSQDEAGSRSVCETEVGRFDGKSSLILDRCNTSREDRKAWLALSSNWSVAPVCVSFEYNRELCTSRAQNRVGHPTLPPGNRVHSAIEQMHKAYVRPSFKEGFSAIVVIRSFSAAEQLAEHLSPPVGLLKFPRTEHLLNLGAVTTDDLVSDQASLILRSDEHVVITEKIDGANMGFSLSSDKTRILVQNRSHYVNPSSHEQFKKLGLWLENHREDLYKVLDRDPLFPQRYILYGEWMAATHSVAYTRLPDWFLTFDVYDRSTATWADRAELEALLEQTGLQIVPLLHRGKIMEEAELKAMVRRTSLFYDGPVEGVYVKVERAGKVVRRGKVVRGDFIAGNEHWTRGGIRLNQLSRELDVS